MIGRMYPNGDQNVTSTITKIIELKKQARESQTYKSVNQKPVTGYITTEDLMGLQKLKDELFPDYQLLQEQLNTRKRR